MRGSRAVIKGEERLRALAMGTTGPGIDHREMDATQAVKLILRFSSLAYQKSQINPNAWWI